MTARAKDAAGKPVANSSTGRLGRPMKALEPRPMSVQTLHSAFHYTESLRVNTGLSLTSLLPGNRRNATIPTKDS